MWNYKIKKVLSIIRHGLEYADVSRKDGDIRPKGAIVWDILILYLRFGITASEYLEYGLGVKTGKEREHAVGILRDKHHWVLDYNDNWRFLAKYSGLKWEKSKRLRDKRLKAYTKRYHMGEKCIVQYGVTFIAEHHSIGTIKIGSRCLFARNCDIDITGDIEIGDCVGILEGAKVLTHAHDSYHFVEDSSLIPFSNRAYKTNLIIGDNVSICAKAIILPGVCTIGENSIVSAGAVVNRPVPPNVIVAGNPATVVRKIPSTVKRTKH